MGGFFRATVAQIAFFFLELPLATFDDAMSKAPLTMHFRTHRKRSNLSREEIAFLIEELSGSTVSRHEAGSRAPSLADALAYEVLFGIPVSALFQGEYERARARTETQAIRLLGKLKRGAKETAVIRQKILFLEDLLRRVRM